MSNEFNNFTETSVNSEISKKILKSSKARISPSFNKLLLKYSLLFSVSILFSLVVCPQRGVSLLRSEFPIFHHILHASEVLCGIYCGLIFFVTTHLVAFLFLSHFERIALYKKYYGALPVALIAVFFGVSMTPLFSTVETSSSYFMAWIIAAGTVLMFHQVLFLNKYNNSMS